MPGRKEKADARSVWGGKVLLEYQKWRAGKAGRHEYKQWMENTEIEGEGREGGRGKGRRKKKGESSSSSSCCC